MGENISLMTRYSIANADYSKTRVGDMYIVEIYKSIENTNPKLRIEITETEEYYNMHPRRKHDSVYDSLRVPTVGRASKFSATLNDMKISVVLSSDQDDIMSAVNNPISVEFNITPKY